MGEYISPFLKAKQKGVVGFHILRATAVEPAVSLHQLEGIE